MKDLMNHVQEKGGITIQYENSPNLLLPKISQVTAVTVMVKYPYLLSLEEGRLLSRTATNLTEQSDFKRSKKIREEYQKTTKLAIEKFEHALLLNPKDIRSLYNLALINLEQAKFLTKDLSSDEILTLLRQSNAKFKELTDYDNEHQSVLKLILKMNF